MQRDTLHAAGGLRALHSGINPHQEIRENLNDLGLILSPPLAPLLIALWRMATKGEIPQGVALRAAA